MATTTQTGSSDPTDPDLSCYQLIDPSEPADKSRKFGQGITVFSAATRNTLAEKRLQRVRDQTRKVTN